MMGRFYEPRSGRRNLLGELLRVAHFDQMLPSSGGYQSHVCNLVNRCFGKVISHYIQKSLSTLRLSHRIRLIVQQESNAEPNSPLEPHPFYSWNLRLSQPERDVYYSTNSKNVNTYMRIFCNNFMPLLQNYYKSSRLVDMKLPQRRKKPMMVFSGNSMNISIARETMFSLE